MQKSGLSHKAVLAAFSVVLVLEIMAAALLGAMAYQYRLPALGFTRIVEAVLLVTIIRLWGGGMASVGITRDSVASGLVKGLLWSAGFGGLALLWLIFLFLLGGNIPRIFPLPGQGSTAGIFLLFMVGGMISPVTEELFFRGIIFGYLRRWGVLLAILGSTALFSMAHLGSSSVMQVPIIGGLVFAIAYEKEKNLLVPIVIHMLGNAAIFIVSNLSVA